MCGLFGFIGEKADAQMLKEVARKAGTRGPHSFGFACVNDGRPAYYKKPEFIGDNLDIFDDLRPSILIGNARLATSGDWRVNENNQPLIDGEVAVTHNGNVYNAVHLKEMYDLDLKTDCDSEVLLKLISNVAAGSFEDRIMNAVDLRDKRSPIALMVMYRGSIYVYRDNQPLYSLIRPEGIYFCSRKFYNAGMIERNKLWTWSN